jgi:anaerobic ribonucleoside-triphosphate reductase activating protein
MHLTINRIICPVYNLGPGCRVAIWLQGCQIGCPGCINPELHNPDGGRRVEISSLVFTLSELVNHMDGITITGGEPFDQYPELMAFCAFFKKKTGKPVYVYSGYTLDELLVRFPDKFFLSVIDLLKAGPYISDLNRDEHYRGSSNQKLYSFEKTRDSVNREIKIKTMPFTQTNSKWSVGIGEKSGLFLTGIPGRTDIQMINQKMNQSGIKSEF